jgi:phosphoribosylanthranilate isomerase
MTLDIKICGLKTEEAIDRAVALGATHVGFIFFQKSPRHIEPADAGRLADRVRGKAKIVSVSVDADNDDLDEIIDLIRPDVLQLHGKETPDRVLNGSDLPGGNGVSFDWRLLAGLDPSVDYFLSGGLNRDNIGDALRIARPRGIDASSGLESNPGVKDLRMIDEFFAAVHSALQAA